MNETLEAVRERERESYNLENEVAQRKDVTATDYVNATIIAGQPGERELQFSELGFICHAKKLINKTIFGKIENITRIGYVKEMRKILLHNSLSFLCEYNI